MGELPGGERWPERQGWGGRMEGGGSLGGDVGERHQGWLRVAIARSLRVSREAEVD